MEPVGKDSKWYSTPQAARRRKNILLTLSPDALARLEWLHEQTGESKSAIVEGLILGTHGEPDPKDPKSAG